MTSASTSATNRNSTAASIADCCYLPTQEEPQGKNVAGLGKQSVFGLTLTARPGEEK